jgi:hypothetical protein
MPNTSICWSIADMTLLHAIYLSYCEGQYVKLWQVDAYTKTVIIFFKLGCIINGTTGMESFHLPAESHLELWYIPADMAQRRLVVTNVSRQPIGSVFKGQTVQGSV